MNGMDPAFMWDSRGITAYDWTNYEGVTSVYPKQFVRFDKYGIYGVKEENWVADSIKDIEDKATFALTWEGLKVTGGDATLRIGNGAKISEDDNTLLKVVDADENTTFAIKSDGTIEWGEMPEVTATTDFDSIWNAFNDKKEEDRENYNQGIYPVESGGERYLGINATLIKTGALCVGDNPYDDDGSLIENSDNKFYADLSEDGAVRIAGWEVTENSIRKTDENGGNVGMFSGDSEYPSLTSKAGLSPIRFGAGFYEKTETERYENIANGEVITLSQEGSKIIEVTYTKSPQSGGGLIIEGKYTDIVKIRWSGSVLPWLEVTYTYIKSPFIILADGSLYANNASISGNIEA
jgi:hypothetical protein